MLSLAKKFCCNYFDKLNDIENYCCLELSGTKCVFAHNDNNTRIRCAWFDKCILPLTKKFVKCPRCGELNEPEILCPKCHRKYRGKKCEQKLAKKMEGAGFNRKDYKKVSLSCYNRLPDETKKNACRGTRNRKVIRKQTNKTKTPKKNAT